MKPSLLFCLGMLFVLPAMTPPCAAQAPASEAVKAVRAHIDALGAQGGGEILERAGGAVGALFPDYRLVVVRFRQFPVARVLPEGLSASNVFAVDRAGKVERLGGVRALEAFFRAHHPPVNSEAQARTTLAAWLALAQEFHQDGMLQFEVLEKEFVLEGGFSSVSGRAVVSQGGNGEVKGALRFDGAGRLEAVKEEAVIRPGPRPICQATLLLDANPLVRRVAEQDLEVMGRAARGYLLEQREKAGPELREAIDRVWRRIETNGW